MVKKKIPGGIPESLKELYRRGERIRFHGFWLGETEMDRAIAEWLDELPARDASGIVKTILYIYITGRLGVKLDAAQLLNAQRADGQLGDSEKALAGLED